MSVLADRFDTLQGVLEDARTVVVTGHEQADGDAVGAVGALRRHLELCDKQVLALLNEPLSTRYAFMLFGDRYEVYDPATHDEQIQAADVYVMCDLSSPGRLGRQAAAWEASDAVKVCVDHHPYEGPGDGPADVNLHDATATATGRIAWDYIQHVEGHVDREIAESVFVSLSTDTGWFRYPNTDPSVVALAAELAGYRLDLPRIHRAIYQSHDEAMLRLLGHAVRTMHVECDGQLAWVMIRRAFIEELGVERYDVDPILDVMRAGRDVGVVALFTELATGDISVSLRSWGDPDVNHIARAFDGGGHAYAAGALLRGDGAAIRMRELVDALRRRARALAS